MICATDDSSRESRDSNASDALIDVGDDDGDDDEKHDGEGVQCQLQMSGSGKMYFPSIFIFEIYRT